MQRFNVLGIKILIVNRIRLRVIYHGCTVSLTLQGQEIVN